MLKMTKKPIVGWTETEDDTYTHVTLTKEEYDNIKKDIQLLENDVKKAKQETAAVKKKAQEAINQANQTNEANIKRAKELLEQEREEVEAQKKLNQNLLRINKERANADRGLIPKKEHTGYVVLMSAEKTQKYGRNKAVDVWETTIQTPYSVDIEEEVARKQIKTDLFSEQGKWLIAEIGINAVYGAGIEKLQRDAEYSKNNCVITQHIKANYKQGYWEMQYTHTKPLKQVPKEMRYSTPKTD